MEVQQDLLTDIEESVWHTDASVGTRFLNLLIDMICIIVLIVLIIGFVFPDYRGDTLGDRILSYTLILAYYTLFEIATQGRTVGKLLTKTKAIRQDGSNLTGTDALLRSLCRLVPFESLSAFSGHPWHDKWTKTRVIKLP